MSADEIENIIKNFRIKIDHGVKYESPNISESEIRELAEKLSGKLGKQVSDDSIFIDHIQNHLTPDKEVVCKICGKTAREITGRVLGKLNNI